MNSALADYERTMQIDPSVLRRLGLDLPVRVRGASGAVGEAFAAGLARSPRFELVSRGFMIEVRADAAQGQACLVGASGAELGCGRAKAQTNDDAQTLARKLLDDFHERVFAAPVDLNQVDANSLDGSNLRSTGPDLGPHGARLRMRTARTVFHGPVTAGRTFRLVSGGRVLKWSA